MHLLVCKGLSIFVYGFSQMFRWQLTLAPTLTNEHKKNEDTWMIRFLVYREQFNVGPWVHCIDRN